MFVRNASFIILSLLRLCADLASAGTASFTNPILDEAGADPWVIRHDSYYYMTYTTNNDITLMRSQTLTDWNNAERKIIFKPLPGQNYSTDLWAPEVHSIAGKWYVIFTADPNYDSPPPDTDALCEWNCPAVHHRMFVLEGVGSNPWSAQFSYKAQLETYDQFAIDGTYFHHEDRLYHIYSCWHHSYDGWPANLCITRMANPWTVTSSLSERQIISAPTNAWEKTPYGRTVNDRLSSNEGPQQLTNPKTGQVFVVYSAARSDNRNYCLGQLELIGKDPMDPKDWRKKNDGCVFHQNPEEDAYGVGHASFVQSPDGTEDWIVYHGMKDPSNGWGARSIRTQKFGWNDDGTPKFPCPGYGPYPVPSGQENHESLHSEFADLSEQFILADKA
ncbi:glycoside hydrolase family 43 protein [Aaosphaeria arxii CBS 175.79]|uniref:Glycoside hydrolase family 43 protein n=1 Tax=Aaosphaeria arxii CBS 175.79 TaxID=1450172 RepID=A0A6A5XHR3_9PLEO|nr:glycoside hydrolase family 43 protein [Aaosphaeria arxii CBS 175.79]KAF2012397.1 glycoside hydrolase family 43 protein [Aaosphaeria arxii CBS 175.79]